MCFFACILPNFFLPQPHSLFCYSFGIGWDGGDNCASVGNAVIESLLCIPSHFLKRAINVQQRYIEYIKGYICWVWAARNFARALDHFVFSWINGNISINDEIYPRALRSYETSLCRTAISILCVN
uniref:Ti plasmid pTi15955 T-DNA region n=1 Tax=Agrobacterium tumefaciens TaxID=358 RepID=Q44387_AGRTU|nr:unnamed protein product [Agrobacterium tumefaciens]